MDDRLPLGHPVARLDEICREFRALSVTRVDNKPGVVDEGCPSQETAALSRC